MWRYFRRHGITRKRTTAHATEQKRPDILKRRQDWFEGQFDLDPERLVFIDETWASTNIARRHGRAPRGERLQVGVPHGHWKSTTFVVGLRLSGIAAPFVLDGPINSDAFETYVAKVLVPELSPGDVVIMDNLSSHKGPQVRATIEAAAANLLYLGPTAPRSTPSRTPSPSSRRSSARPSPAPFPASGPPSAASSRPSHQQNAPTTLPQSAMMQHEGKPL